MSFWFYATAAAGIWLLTSGCQESVRQDDPDIQPSDSGPGMPDADVGHCPGLAMPVDDPCSAAWYSNLSGTNHIPITLVSPGRVTGVECRIREPEVFFCELAGDIPDTPIAFLFFPSALFAHLDPTAWRHLEVDTKLGFDLTIPGGPVVIRLLDERGDLVLLMAQGRLPEIVSEVPGTLLSEAAVLDNMCEDQLLNEVEGCVIQPVGLEIDSIALTGRDFFESSDLCGFVHSAYRKKDLNPWDNNLMPEGRCQRAGRDSAFVAVTMFRPFQ